MWDVGVHVLSQSSQIVGHICLVGHNAMDREAFDWGTGRLIQCRYYDLLY